MKLVRLVLSCCVVAAGCVTLSGCGDQKSVATPPEKVAPPLPSDTKMGKDNVDVIK